MQSHPTLSFEVRSTLYECLNYKKLSFEASKDIAKNPKTPPNIACQALLSLKSTNAAPKGYVHNEITIPFDTLSSSQMASFNDIDQKSPSRESEDTTLAIKKMERRVKELEKVCREMRGQMSRLVKNKVVTSSSSPQYRSLPVLCRITHM